MEVTSHGETPETVASMGYSGWEHSYAVRVYRLVNGQELFEDSRSGGLVLGKPTSSLP